MNEISYKGFDKAELEFQYNPRESVPEYPELAKRRSGTEPKGTLDVKVLAQRILWEFRP